jgi:hypothetical protein
VDRPLPRRRHSYPHVGLIDLPSGSEHAPRSTSARPRRDSDDAVFAVREGSGGRARIAERNLCAGDATGLGYLGDAISDFRVGFLRLGEQPVLVPLSPDGNQMNGLKAVFAAFER